VEGDGRDRELARERAAVQRLDVGELVTIRNALGVDRVLAQSVEHEGVVGIGRVREDECLTHELCSGFFSTRDRSVNVRPPGLADPDEGRVKKSSRVKKKILDSP
jgi:hypothetical protein